MKKFFVIMLICLEIFSVAPVQAKSDFILKNNCDNQFVNLTANIGWVGAYVVNCNEWISLREYRSTQAPRLAKIPLGAYVEIHEDTYINGFWQVRYRGIVGYALGDYLRIGHY